MTTKRTCTISVNNYGDDELNAIALASAAIDRIDPAAQKRVVDWIVSKYAGREALDAVDRVREVAP